MLCWSCQKAAGDGMLCAHCKAVQPPDTKADYFSVLGVPRAFALDATLLEQRYKELTKVLHPDRFARLMPMPAERRSNDRVTASTKPGGP